MRKFLSFNLHVKYSLLSLAFIVMLLPARSQTVVRNGHCTYQYPDRTIKQTQVGNLQLPGASAFKGFMERLPSDYDANPGKKYPLMIFIPGGVQLGNGYPEYYTNTDNPNRKSDSTGLCALFGPSLWTGFPTNMVEGWPTPFPDSVIHPITKERFSFILISVQMQWYDFGVPSSLNVFIDYLQQRYRVDPGRIYLTAISKGAGYALEWLGASEANASRIAAAVLSSPCGYYTQQGIVNMTRAHLPIWTLTCHTDDVCPITGTTYAQELAKAMNNQTPAPNPKLWIDTFPMPGMACKPMTHDTWGYIFDKAFKRPVNGGPTINAYEWMVQYDRSAIVSPLPVNFTSFTARLNDKKVYLNWTVAQEKNNKEFTIERAGADQQFTVLTTVPSRGDASASRSYQTVDNSPLNDISYYRLSQTDKDGKKTVYEIRKVINSASTANDLIISPNPFNQQFSVYVTLKKAQRISFTINDIAGKKVQSMQGLYAEGSSEINIRASNLRPGVYFLRVEGESFSYVKKIIKN